MNEQKRQCLGRSFLTWTHLPQLIPQLNYFEDSKGALAASTE